MKKLFVLMAILIVAVMLSGCGEKAAEKAIETSTGGSVDVDFDDNSMKINTNAGSLEVGEKVSLPAGFPSDVHVVDGTIVTAMTITEGETYTVSIQTSKTVNSVKKEYESELASDGWDVTMSLAVEDGFTMSAEKGDRMVIISIGSEDEGALVVLSTSKTDY